jgi:hypothetical protein
LSKVGGLPGRAIMKTYYAVALSMLAGVALGGAAIQGLHAQTKSSKAYTVTELETLDAKTAADVAARIQKMQEAQAAIISVLAVERLRLWKDRRRLSVSRSRNGIILRKHRHSSSRRPGPILDRNVIRLSRPYADMRWKLGTNELYRGRSLTKREAVSFGGPISN